LFLFLEAQQQCTFWIHMTLPFQELESLLKENYRLLIWDFLSLFVQLDALFPIQVHRMENSSLDVLLANSFCDFQIT